MDPVNKWLTVIILFMCGVLFVGWNAAGSGRYEMEVALVDGAQTVFVLDTKDGEVKAQVVDSSDLYNNTGQAYVRPHKVFEWPSGTQYGRRY